jgi:RHS repeat-associated protein
MDYEPYGAPIANARSSNPAGLRHTYTGQEDDSETGLMYYGARYYDPVVGMFTSPDLLTLRPNQP